MTSRTGGPHVRAAVANADQRARWSDRRYVERMDRWELLTSAVTPFLLDALALVPGDRVVDIGCGLGAASRAAGAAVGPGGSVLGVDISAPLVAEAARRSASRSAATTVPDWQVADAQTDSFLSGPFTAAMSQFGLMFFADPVAAFANIRRQLEPGGRLVFTCWPDAERCPWSFSAVLADLLPRPRTDPRDGPAPGPFSLADPQRVTRLLAAAGFAGVELQTVTTTVDLPEDAVVDDLELTLMGVTAASLDPARERVAAQLASLRADSGRLLLPLTFHLVVAVDGSDHLTG